MSGLDAILDRARALRDLRDGTSNVHEAEAAARALASLMEKHRIAEAELEAAGGDHEPVVFDTDAPLYSYTRTVFWKMRLARVLCEHHGVAIYRSRTTLGRGYALCLAGRSSDVAIVRYMWAWLSAAAQRLSSREASGRGRVYVRSWLDGFVLGVRVQLASGRADARAGASSRALVAIDGRLADAARYVQATTTVGPSVTVGSRAQVDRVACSDGFVAGRAVHLGDTLDATVVKSLPGKADV